MNVKHDDFRDEFTNSSDEEYTTTRYYDPENISNKGTSKKVKKPGNTAKRFLSVILIILLSAGAGFGGGLAAMYYGESFIGPNSVNEIKINPNDDINTAEAIALKVIPSVVGISTSTEITYQGFFGQQRGIQSGVGTGIIVDEKGYILTNSHVISDGNAKEIIVQLSDGKEVEGTVLWYDKSIDLAIVKIEAVGLTPAELGNSDEVRIGSYAAAIGNPLGMAFDRSVTQGVISGLNRTITVSDGQSQLTMEGLIQTDASINSGNSGGPLLNSAGQVIGINSAKAQSGEGLGFAIPINTAKPIVDEIKTKGEFKRSYIGIRGGNVADFLQINPGIDLGTKTGVYVAQIYSDSPAAKVGLKEGDIIIGVEGEEVRTMSQLISTLFKYRPGDTIDLTVLRMGRKMNFTVTLTSMDETIELPRTQIPQ
jgi:S1-C subfamily serine protease